MWSGYLLLKILTLPPPALHFLFQLCLLPPFLSILKIPPTNQLISKLFSTMSLKVLFLYYAKPVKHHFCFLASTIVLHFTILFSCLCKFGPSKKYLYVESRSWFGEYLRGREKSDISVLSLESLLLFHTIKCFFQSTHMFTMSFVRPLSCI